MTRDTVIAETPAFRPTSRIVTTNPLSVSYRQRMLHYHKELRAGSGPRLFIGKKKQVMD